ncbi:MAG: hypothetical protein CMJ46_05615 [Planctomyces sp.]|nr:hypothetical protein [Planctomyces sp.]
MNISLKYTLIFPALALTLLVAGMTGCQSSADATASAADEKEHEHEHSHAPGYKPETFEAAVVAIEEQLRHLQDEIEHGHLHHGEEDLALLREFIHWLPELAGDTDMPEPEWNQVQAGSEQMLEQCSQLEQQFRSGKLETGIIPPLLAEIEKQQALTPFAVDKLTRLGPAQVSSEDSQPE